MVDFDEILAPQFGSRGYRSTVRNRVCLIKLKPKLSVESARLSKAKALSCLPRGLPHRLQPLLRSHNMRWFDFLAASIFIGVTVLLLGGTAMSVRQRTADIYLAEAQPRVAAQQ
jgi:hypothetical protein